MADRTASVVLVRGSDAVLLGDAVREEAARLLADADAALALEDIAPGDEADLIGRIVQAARTPPFLTDRRVVIGRELGSVNTADVQPLLDYLADPSPTTGLVLAGGGGQIPDALVKAVRAAGAVIDADAPMAAKPRATWVAEHLKEGPVHLDREATARVIEHLGEDVARIAALLDLLAAAHGRGARLGVDDVEDYLGEAGGVAPWELTDAIDAGDTPLALAKLHRMVEGGARHPLVVLATLHNHYARIMRLDGAAVDSGADAAALLGIKGSTFPAEKALKQARRLGSERVARAMQLLAGADLDLKGRRDLPEIVVLEVLVARLSRLGPRTRPAAGGRRR
jgi:DNA polymerase III subunit delta